MIQAILQPGYWQHDIDEGKPYRLLICEPTFKMIKLIAWPQFNSAIPPGFKINESKSDWIVYVQGIHGLSEVIFASYEQGAEKIEGLSIYGAFLDEAFQAPESFYHEVQNRVSDRSGRITLSGTPKPVEWLVDLIDKSQTDSDIFYKTWTTRDNPYFPKERLEYLKKMLPPKIFRRNFEAALDAFTGQVYESFDRAVHGQVWEIKKSDYQYVWASIDWGWTHNASFYVYGLRGDDEVDVLHEVSEPGILIHGEGRTWASILLHYQNLYAEKFEFVEAGPDRPENIAAIKIRGVRIRAADNAVIEGIQFVSALLHIDERGKSRLRIHAENCPRLLKKIPMLRWQENPDGTLSEKQLKKDDDECDSLRYGLFSMRKWFKLWELFEQKSIAQIETKW